jgi:hypothetical protein
MVTRVAADRYGFDVHYESTPSWATYESLLQFAKLVREDVRDLRPRDMIDVQSLLWVLGSRRIRALGAGSETTIRRLRRSSKA